MEGMKVLYRVAIALSTLFSKMSNTPGSAWEADIEGGHFTAAMTTFCKNLPVSIFNYVLVKHIFFYRL
jgi:hypothetical protein